MNWRSEYKKCLLDPSRKYMIEKFLQMQLWPIQNDLLVCASTKQYTVVTKSRDVGFTTTLAAYVACELALNSDDGDGNEYTITYLALTSNMMYDFRCKVMHFLDYIPAQLFTNENKKIVSNKQNGITVGNASLNLSVLHDRNQFTIQNVSNNKNKTDLLIFDEPVCGSNAWVNEYDVKSFLEIMQSVCKRVITGGTPNHKNKWWFDVVSEAKNKYMYLLMPWYSNKDHQENDDDIPKLYIAHDGSVEYTNKWFEKRRYYINNSDLFDEEINCKVWKEKIVKEYV